MEKNFNKILIQMNYAVNETKNSAAQFNHL